ncbi:TolC family protein [bacterium]|nr:TolC family protein [bacterium]
MIPRLIMLTALLTAWAGAAPLTLEEACRLSLLAQPRLQAAEARVERSQAFERESWTPWNPRLGLEGNYTYTTPNATFNQGGQNIVFSQNNNYLATLRLTQLIWNGGFYASQAEARKWQVMIQQERSRETQLQVEEEAGLAFLTTKSALENVRLNEQQVSQRQAQLKQSQLLFEKGTVPRYDVMRADAEVSRAQQELIETQRLLLVRRSALNSLLQQSVTELADLPEPAPFPPATWEQAQNRPDLHVAALALNEAQSRLDAARTEHSPSLSFQGDIQQRNAVVAFPATQYNTGLVLSWPLYDQGQSAARSEQVEAELKELEAQAREVERVARLEVEQLQADVSTRYSAWLNVQKQCEAAREAQRIGQVRYENGLSTEVERLDADLNYTRALRDRIYARYELGIAQCRLRRALGQSQLAGSDSK